MNILWHSNSPECFSGYGDQSHLFTPLIKKAGYPINISSFYGIEGHSVINSDGIVELPRSTDAWSNLIIQAHMQYTKSDVCITLIDPFVLDSNIYKTFPNIMWCPLDSDPAMPENINAMQSGTRLWAMSHFGEYLLNKAGFTNFDYVPHGTNTDEFKPIDRKTAREEFSEIFKVDLEGKFLINTVAANKGRPNRKNLGMEIELFSIFNQKYPNSLLYLHTEPQGVFQGENLIAVAQAFGVKDKVLFPSQYKVICGLYDNSYLNMIYNASDVSLFLSRGEGFGIGLISSQAAGCPVIAVNFSAMRELAQEVGILIDCSLYQFTPPVFQAIPLMDSALQALESAYTYCDTSHEDYYPEWRDESRMFGLTYDHRLVFDKYMKPSLKNFENYLESKKQEEEIIVVSPKDKQ